jgi:crotonobetainyl-CoA:carnitine CoA-transferase CaiB-like acyl-CoA transferase
MREATVDACDLWSDPRFATPDSRRENDRYLAVTLANAFAAQPASAWEETLAGVDIACPAISQTSLSEFTISSPAMTANGFVDNVVHPLFGPHLRHGPIVTLSRTPGVTGPGSLPGQHTRSVLAELGYSESQIQTLRDQGIVGWSDDTST